MTAVATGPGSAVLMVVLGTFMQPGKSVVSWAIRMPLAQCVVVKVIPCLALIVGEGMSHLYQRGAPLQMTQSVIAPLLLLYPVHVSCVCMCVHVCMCVCVSVSAICDKSAHLCILILMVDLLQTL